MALTLVGYGLPISISPNDRESPVEQHILPPVSYRNVRILIVFALCARNLSSYSPYCRQTLYFVGFTPFQKHDIYSWYWEQSMFCVMIPLMSSTWEKSNLLVVH